jgi:hypothetical protein
MELLFSKTDDSRFNSREKHMLKTQWTNCIIEKFFKKFEIVQLLYGLLTSLVRSVL